MDKTLPSHCARALVWLALLLASLGTAQAEPELVPIQDVVRRFVEAQLSASGAARSQVTLGELDPRLRLQPCEKLQPYLPSGTHLWGKTRVGVRCVKGAIAWTVYLRVNVSVFGPGLVASGELPAGHVLGPQDFHQAEVDLAEDLSSAPLTDAALLLGRTLARPVLPGQRLNAAALKPRQWFAAGDQVQIRVEGSGFAVAGSGEAITAGLEGQRARVRTDSGRVVSGMPVAQNQLEVAL